MSSSFQMQDFWHLYIVFQFCISIIICKNEFLNFKSKNLKTYELQAKTNLTSKTGELHPKPNFAEFKNMQKTNLIQKLVSCMI